MNMIAMNMDRTVHGMTEYFRSDKTVVLLIAVLLYLWLKEKKSVDNKVNRLLLYTMVMTGILLFPITAMIMVIYQTAFYDYAWAWSMVPCVAVIAYGLSVFLMDMEGRSKKKIVPVVAVIALILLVCGNQGTIRTNEEVVGNGQIEAIAEHAVQDAKDGQAVLWAPKNIMQEVRRYTGEIRLIYGRDMWDEKAGAYDYEAYDENQMEAYEWMELVDMLAGEVESEENFRILCGEYQLAEGAFNNTSNMLEDGVNVIVLPKLAVEMYEGVLEDMMEAEGREMDELYTEQYAVYLLK